MSMLFSYQILYFLHNFLQFYITIHTSLHYSTFVVAFNTLLFKIHYIKTVMIHHQMGQREEHV